MRPLGSIGTVADRARRTNRALDNRMLVNVALKSFDPTATVLDHMKEV